MTKDNKYQNTKYELLMKMNLDLFPVCPPVDNKAAVSCS